MKSFPLCLSILGIAVAAAAEPRSPGRLQAEALEAFGALEPASLEEIQSPRARLGRFLFWDPRLSANGTTACASCHLAADWGADARPLSRDARGKDTSRHSQTVFNAMLQPALRWTGDRTSGAHQAERSLTGSMGFTHATNVIPVLKQNGYEDLFRTAWPEVQQPINPTHYAQALQSYQATLVTPAPFDRFLQGDHTALGPPQLAGLQVFLDRGCADCHDGPLLGGRKLRRFGVKQPYWEATGSPKQDPGLFETTRDEADRNTFRVSMLRNIARTAPYFHDGSVSELREAVQVMAQVQGGLRLAASEAEAVVAFLEALTGTAPEHFAPPLRFPGQ